MMFVSYSHPPRGKRATPLGGRHCARIFAQAAELMFMPDGGWCGIRSRRRCKAWAALADSNSCCRIRAATRSPTWIALRTRLWAPAQPTRNWPICTHTFSANDPQELVTIDREKAKAMDVSISQIATTINVFMGSEYVNDFDFNDRTYRVYVQADQPFRMKASDLHSYYVRSDSGKWCPWIAW